MSFNPGPGEKVIFEGHPSWRAILDFYVKGILVTGVVAALVALWGKTIGDGVNGGLVALVLVVGAAITVLAGFVRRASTQYTITNRRLHIKHGIVSREVQETRLNRVQDVSYSQSLLQRLLQVGDVDFDTASDDPTDFVFAGVADPGEIVEAVHRATGPTEESGLGDESPPGRRP